MPDKLKYKFKLLIDCIDGAHLKHEWIREIELSAEMTCHELHQWIAKEIGFYKNHPFSFYYGDKYGQKYETVIEPLMPYRYFCFQEDWKAITVRELFPMIKRNRWLYYNYDNMASWIFRLKKIGKDHITEENEQTKIIKSLGKNPQQYTNE